MAENGMRIASSTEAPSATLKRFASSNTPLSVQAPAFVSTISPAANEEPDPAADTRPTPRVPATPDLTLARPNVKSTLVAEAKRTLVAEVLRELADGIPWIVAKSAPVTAAAIIDTATWPFPGDAGDESSIFKTDDGSPFELYLIAVAILAV